MFSRKQPPEVFKKKKKLLLKFFQISQENTCVGVSYNKFDVFK